MLARALVILLLLASAVIAPAKVISGTVTDMQDKPVAKATVVVENEDTHQRITVLTDKAGRFVVRNLAGANYTVFISPEANPSGLRLRLDSASPAGEKRAPRAPRPHRQ